MTNLEKTAENRAKIVNLASRGRLPEAVKKVVRLDDDVLLDDVTRAARDSLLAETTLTEAIAACAEADIDRDDVIAAVVAAGWSEAGARSRVSVGYCAAGKRERKKGAGRETPRFAIELAEYTTGKCADIAMAIKMTRAALRYLTLQAEKAEKKAAKPVAVKAEAPAVPVASELAKAA